MSRSLSFSAVAPTESSDPRRINATTGRRPLGRQIGNCDTARSRRSRESTALRRMEVGTRWDQLTASLSDQVAGCAAGLGAGFPASVEDAVAVVALVGVSAEVVALGLDEIGGQARRVVGVVIVE